MLLTLNQNSLVNNWKRAINLLLQSHIHYSTCNTSCSRLLRPPLCPRWCCCKARNWNIPSVLFRILLWHHHCNMGHKNGHNAKYLVASVVMKSGHLWYLGPSHTDSRCLVSPHRTYSPEVVTTLLAGIWNVHNTLVVDKPRDNRDRNAHWQLGSGTREPAQQLLLLKFRMQGPGKEGRGHHGYKGTSHFM